MNIWRSRIQRDKVLNALREGGDTIVVWDFETSGLSAAKEVPIQISGLKVKTEVEGDKLKLVPIEKFDQYINIGAIGKRLHPKITEITGITDAVLAEAKPETEVYQEWSKFIKDVKIFAGYNSGFDVRFGNAMANRYGETFEPEYHLDVLEMARDLVEKEDTENYKLATISGLYGITAKFHDSFEDVTATLKLLEIFINEYIAIENEELNTPPEPLKKPKVFSMSRWEGWRGHARIYFHTNCEDFYYDIYNKNWQKQKRANMKFDISQIDMEWLRKAALQYADENIKERIAKGEELRLQSIADEKDLAKWTIPEPKEDTADEEDAIPSLI